jgi:hypothetical protein
VEGRGKEERGWRGGRSKRKEEGSRRAGRATGGWGEPGRTTEKEGRQEGRGEVGEKDK